ncbi:MAG: hypothetical protein KME05_06190 [Gloeocapsa sp. UFS-A4-WI-NPMV-4B04]|jgi:hypothetical protein|nr:hypothetical protein [Gloeocapsa sp. UFS-A4-WI-NPMV-4B04]
MFAEFGKSQKAEAGLKLVLLLFILTKDKPGDYLNLITNLDRNFEREFMVDDQTLLPAT